MRNIAKGSVLLFLVALVMGVTYFQIQKVEAVTEVELDSQENIQADIKELYSEKNVEKYDVNVEVENGEEANAESGARSFKATAYCLRGRTASGRMVRRGLVAADPRVLRLGTRIHMTGGKYTGNYLVADTGGKIKGRILDIWVPSCREARIWGRRTVKVRVLSKGKSKKRKKRRRRRN